jgi:predicted nucleic acid-binding protein
LLTLAVCLAWRAALAFAAALLDQPDGDVVWVDEALHREGMRLLTTRIDKRYSLADAIGFLLMRRLGLIVALTTGHHFEQAGLVRLLRP